MNNSSVISIPIDSSIKISYYNNNNPFHCLKDRAVALGDLQERFFKNKLPGDSF